MKTIKSFMLILSVCLILGAIAVGSCSAQAPTDYLKVKGEIFNEYNATITVYASDDKSIDAWSKIASKTVSKKYRLRLATDKDYQIFFMSDAGHTKVVHIKAGDPGTYLEYIDIDFEGSSERHACMYQNDEGYYTFQTKIEYYSTASLE
jgi:hypothetical protein